MAAVRMLGEVSEADLRAAGRSQSELDALRADGMCFRVVTVCAPCACYACVRDMPWFYCSERVVIESFACIADGGAILHEQIAAVRAIYPTQPLLY